MSLAEDNRDIISSFNNTPMNKSDSVNSLSSESYRNVEYMRDYIIPATDSLNSILVANFEDFLKKA